MSFMQEAVREWTWTVGSERKFQQWILSDYDTWEPNPHYVGPDQGHPEDGEVLCNAEHLVLCTVWATFKEASEEAKRAAINYSTPTTVENYKDQCWVVYY